MGDQVLIYFFDLTKVAPNNLSNTGSLGFICRSFEKPLKFPLTNIVLKTLVQELFCVLFPSFKNTVLQLELTFLRNNLHGLRERGWVLGPVLDDEF